MVNHELPVGGGYAVRSLVLRIVNPYTTAVYSRSNNLQEG
jgi:hypothetical protein